METLLMVFLFAKLVLCIETVDECGDKCFSTQVCGKDGTCINRSDLVKCGFNFCRKDEGCCGFDRCIPAGDVCCGVSYFNCKRGQTCCGLGRCCLSGYFCENKKCVPDKFSTAKPPSSSTPAIARTTKPTTRSPTAKPTERPNDYIKRRSVYRVLFPSAPSVEWCCYV